MYCLSIVIFTRNLGCVCVCGVHTTPVESCIFLMGLFLAVRSVENETEHQGQKKNKSKRKNKCNYWGKPNVVSKNQKDEKYV